MTFPFINYSDKFTNSLKKFLLIVTFILPQIHTAYPQNASNEIMLSEDLLLKKISANAYIHISYVELPQYGRIPSNGLIYFSGKDAFLFDTPMNEILTPLLVSWIQDTMKLKLRGFIPNHWHSDCMAGLKYLNTLGVESYANEMTIQIAQSKNLPLPKHGFNDSLCLQLNGNEKEIDCYYLGAGHSLDNIVAWIPSEKILFGGCMVRELSATGIGNTIDGDRKAWPHTINKIIQRFPEAKIVIPGHGNFGEIELLHYTVYLLETGQQ